MKHRFKVAVVAVAFILGSLGAGPANAGHANALGHWDQQSYPVVSAAQSGWDASIQDAAYYWQDVAFHRGYYPPLPNRNVSQCGAPYIGHINYCLTGDNNDPRLNGKDGWTNVWWDGHKHIYSATTVIKSSLQNPVRQRIFRHEFGHALGLGHNTHGWSVMNDPVGTPYVDVFDVNGILTWQANHAH